jgi:hypothetical protein
MAPRLRTLPLACSAAILLTALSNAPTVLAEPEARPATTRVAPVPRVDLGAPDPRCSDLAYPLWDDGMCVRAKCADDDACDFSRVASAREPPAPVGLARERWRTATARPVKSTDTRSVPTQFAAARVRAKDSRRAVGLPLLAEARIVDPRLAKAHARASDPTSPSASKEFSSTRLARRFRPSVEQRGEWAIWEGQSPTSLSLGATRRLRAR